MFFVEDMVDVVVDGVVVVVVVLVVVVVVEHVVVVAVVVVRVIRTSTLNDPLAFGDSALHV